MAGKRLASPLKAGHIWPQWSRGSRALLPARSGLYRLPPPPLVLMRLTFQPLFLSPRPPGLEKGRVSISKSVRDDRSSLGRPVQPALTHVHYFPHFQGTLHPNLL